MISAKNPVRITKRPAGTDGAVSAGGGVGRAWSAGAYESLRIDRRGGLRRPRPQVSDLGAAASGCTSREGHRDGAHADQAPRLTAYRVGRRGTGMTTGSASGTPDVAGGPARHIPVRFRPVVAHLGVRAGGIYIDGTFGAGGVGGAILPAAECKVLALDRDQSAVAQSAGLVEESGGRLTVAEGRFSALDEAAASFGIAGADGVVLDLGVSSMQLDSQDRGFSFRLAGPLDMRMDAGGPSAADVVATASERTLADIIFALGEERHSRAVARAIVKARAETPIRTTRALADIVGRVVHGRRADTIRPTG